MPTKFSSKVNNIFLVALINSNDLKSKETDFNHIWRPIVDDFKRLESDGITSKEGNIKAVLTHLSFDNLGANDSLGFASSFSASYYCRFCLLSKAECQHTTHDDSDKRRTIEDYEAQVQIIANSEKVVYNETKGVKYYCTLNDLHYFHVINNPTVDVMHDHNEGSIPYLLSIFFEHCFSNKVFSLEQLRDMVQFHDYGWLNRKNVPSQIKLEVRSLGQNGSQSICLFRHLPFILYKFKGDSNFISLWKCVQYLLQIMVIVYSHVISEKNVECLEKLIAHFLKSILATFKEPLIPKLHFLLHYPSIIRMVGPVIYMSTMRYEAKHQFFKNIIKKTKNLRNINKSLALKHEQNLCVQGVTCDDKITTAKCKPISLENISRFEDTISEYFFTTDNLMETECLFINNYEFKNGFLFIHNAILYRILKIVCFENKYFFLSQ